MLVELSITNLAIIDSLRLVLSPGFNVLTGETGAGKSIIIDATSLLLGERASAEMIRTGCAKGAVEGVFEIGQQDQLGPLLERLGLEDALGEGTLILRREISRSRRNICRVNGQAVTLSALQEIGRHLVDIHGQGDHLSLLRARRHIDFLDRYGDLWEQRQSFAELVGRLRQVRRELRALQQDKRELARRIDLLTYQIGEIESARLQEGEETKLRQRRALLANAEKRMQLAAGVYALLYESDEEQRSAVDLLGAIVENLVELAHLDDAVADQSALAETTSYQLEDLAHAVRDYRDEIEFDPQELTVIEERLGLLQGLKLKYGDSTEEVLAFAERAREELGTISHSEERIAALQEAERALLQEIAAVGQALTAQRREVAERLGMAIEDELRQLSMERARFAVHMHWHQDGEGVDIDGQRYGFDHSGLDRVEFFIAPNPGEDLKPLVKTASGGETSRIMLALKTALSTVDPVPTLIFDEIDAGIGGRTGSVVGRKLRALARDHQVFCITHLPQIACYSQQHFLVAKQVAQGRTVSAAVPLSRDERVAELALMLGGTLTASTRRSAEELLQRVENVGGSD